jgi:hypothetical protein
MFYKTCRLECLFKGLEELALFIAPLGHRRDRRKLPHPNVVWAVSCVNFIEIKLLVRLLNYLEIKYQEIKKIASFGLVKREL